MLPRTLCLQSSHLEGDRIVPHYLSARDEPWLGALLEEHRRFAGLKRSALQARLREPLAVRVPRSKLRLACHVLERATLYRAPASIASREARHSVFRAAAEGSLDRAAALSRVAAALGVTSQALEAALFADLACERRVAAAPSELSPARLAVMANQALVMALVGRAVDVRFGARGETLALLERAHHSGLICNVEEAEAGESDALVMTVSGPYALFRHTALYARALAELVPLAVRCERYEIQARCAFSRGGPTANLVVRSGDPVDAGHADLAAEKQLAPRFAREIARAAPGWSVAPSAAPLKLGGSLCYPDYVLRHERAPGRPYYLEWVGFWTRAHIAAKVAQLSAAGVHDYVLCVDRQRCCGTADSVLPEHPSVLAYSKRFEVPALLRLLATR